MQDNDYKFFTIGYEGNSFEHYLNRLINNNVKVLCDVRKNAISRKYGFSKKTLANALENLGIQYIHFSELGIESEKRKNLIVKSDYDALFEEYENTTLKENAKALENIYNVFLEKKRVAITCFEADHCMCHRNSVVKALLKFPSWQFPIEHI